MVQKILLNHHRIEIYRAVELLNDFYIRVIKSREKHLIIDVERIIRAFKSKFFQALIDIQEYYTITLVDNFNYDEAHTTEKQNSAYPWNIICHRFCSISCESEFKRLNQSYETFQVNLRRRKTGLGFSIAGGIDNPHFPNDYHIYITKIIPDGAAALDGRLRINDVIERVNDQSTLNINHSTAVLILKQAGDEVTLHIRRRKIENDIIEIELFKSCDGFGFSIAGGKDNQHVPGDNGIFITKISEGGVAYSNERLEIGDKILGIRNSHGIEMFDNILHQQAVEILKATEDRIILLIKKRLDFIISADHGCPSTKKDASILQSNQDVQGGLKDIRHIHLSKGLNGFGFNIIGGDDGDSIYISSVLEGGPAFIDGRLKKGDKILMVNGICFEKICHEKAVTILKETSDEIELLVEYDLEDFIAFEKKLSAFKKSQSLENVNSKTMLKTNEKKFMFVRALFTYDSSKDEDLPSTALSFYFGDILHVTNASDEEWWVASKVLSNEGFGIIPSRKRWERKQRARDRTVKFEGNPSILPNKLHLDKRRKNYSFSRKFPFMKNKEDKCDDYSEQEPFMLCYTQTDVKPEDVSTKEILYRVELPHMEELTLVYLEKDLDEEDAQQLCGDENILSYEEVEQINITFARPVVILGPIKDKINDDLISQHPEKFGSCVPHTTRSKREDEIEGRDYYFVTSRDQMELDIQNHLFIEAGQYNENLYGTSTTSVKKVAQEGKHCILDVSGNAIKRLYAARLYPIALFVKVTSVDSLMKILKNITEDQAKKLYFQSLKTEQEFNEYFTGIIEGEDYEQIYKQIIDVITNEAGQHIWIPSKYQQI